MKFELLVTDIARHPGWKSRRKNDGSTTKKRRKHDGDIYTINTITYAWLCIAQLLYVEYSTVVPGGQILDSLRQKAFFIGDWKVSPTEGLLFRGEDIVHLEPKAMELLVYLAQRQGEVVTR